jgi:rhodanese-related sulfurtransferase
MDCSRRKLLGQLIVLLASMVPAVGRRQARAQPGSGRHSPQTRKVPVDGRAGYTDVNAAGLAAMLETRDFPLINVHIPYEGEIEGTDLLIPFDQIEANLGKLPPGQAARVILYCRSGVMSATAARALVKRGYTDVWNLEGGMIAWEQAGYPLLHRRR